MAVVKVDIDELKKFTGVQDEKLLMDRLGMFGTPVEGLEGRALSVEIFPNRPDMMTVEGMARSLRGFMDIEGGLKIYSTIPSEYEIIVDPKILNIRPACSFAIIKNIKMTDDLLKALMHVQEKLHDTLGRKRKKASIGLYDLSKIKGKIRYTAITPEDFAFTPLEGDRQLNALQILKYTQKGKDYAHLLEKFAEYPVLVDENNTIMSLIPIVNSEETKVDLDTKTMLIESTGWDQKAVEKMVLILATSLADRGFDLETVKVSGAYNWVTPNLQSETMLLDPEKTRKFIGENISENEIMNLLRKMRFNAEKKDRGILVHVPVYRTDIMHQVDLIEECIIAMGYENFNPEVPLIHTDAIRNPAIEFSNRIRNLMIGLGFIEAFTFSMSSKDRMFSKMNIPEKNIVEVLNPKTEDYTILRDSMLPSLIEVLNNSRAAEYPQNVFEVGEVVKLDDSSDTLTRNEWVLGAVQAAETNFSSIKGVAEVLLSAICDNYELKPSNHPSFIEGRAANIIVNNKEIGFFGEVKPQVIVNWELKVPVTALEINLSSLYKKGEEKK